MGHVYGDSTVFPFDINFVELIRHAVECGVTLMGAQHSIATAVDRSGNFDQLRKQERARMDAMSDAIKLTMTAFMSSHSERMVRTASRVLESARAVIESELAMLEGQANGEISNTRATVERSREATFRAVETFVLRHDLPNTSVGLRLLAGEESYWDRRWWRRRSASRRSSRWRFRRRTTGARSGACPSCRRAPRGTIPQDPAGRANASPG